MLLFVWPGINKGTGIVNAINYKFAMKGIISRTNMYQNEIMSL